MTEKVKILRLEPVMVSFRMGCYLVKGKYHLTVISGCSFLETLWDGQPNQSANVHAVLGLWLASTH